MAKIVTLGEIMMRLSPPGYERFEQATQFDVHYGGGEANVACSLAQFGHEVSFVTKLPENALGSSAIAFLRSLGVDCSHVVRGGNRIGIYFLENGASVRASSVIYDRAESSMAQAVPEDFDFDSIFEGKDLFHVSGITAVLSPACGKIAVEAVKAAKRHGVIISLDLNYRAKLWKDHIPEKQQVMQTLMELSDICFGNALDAAKCCGYTDHRHDFLQEDYNTCVEEKAMCDVVKAYHLKYLVTSLRNNISASDNGWSAEVCDGSRLYKGKTFQLHIVDRVGGGDSFAAGFLHAVLAGAQEDPQYAIEFAIAAAAIKHTLPGDVNYTSVSEVEQLAFGSSAGRINR